MVTGYGGTYRAAVVDDADPMQQYRLGVIVPEVYGDDVSVWAVASRAGSSTMPVVGDLVWISFEHGDTDYPIWHLDAASEEPGSGSGGYVGKYRGLVVGNDDPMQQHRLEVTVPEVDSSTSWATASDDMQYVATPDVGTTVWIEYQYGDPTYPQWVGLA
jgi:Type VI secretion system/phage-baseplate injector OB domain